MNPGDLFPVGVLKTMIDRIRSGSLWAIAAALSLLMCTAALAQSNPATVTVNNTWVNPTTWSDGTPLVATAITLTTIEYGTCIGSGSSLAIGTVQGQYVAQGGATHTSSSVPLGSCEVAITTATNAAGQSVAGLASAAVQVGQAPAPPANPAVPGAPASFTATPATN